MAELVLGGVVGGVRNRFREVRTHVYAKRAVGDEWTYLPYLACLRCEQVAGPGVGSAELAFTFGRVARAETKVFEFFDPYLLQRAYVKVEVNAGFGSVPVWYGVVESEQVRPHGDAGVATGKQTFTAYELSHLLDRAAVVGSYVAAGAGTAFIDETLVFNAQVSGRAELFPNHLGGVFGVGEEATLWSAWDVLNYVFSGFVNGAYGITFVGHGGAQDALLDSYERWDFRGMTAKQILDYLVDRKKGLGWCVVPEDDLGTVYIHVFSGMVENVAAGEGYIPANENQTDLVFAGYRDVTVDYHFGEMSHFDTVRVIGGPIYVTGSFSFADGTLEPNWTAEQELAYINGSEKVGASTADHDQRRGEQDLVSVYQRFRVPVGWDGYLGDGEGGTRNNALPKCLPTGFISTNEQAVGFRPGKRLERTLPWNTEADGAFAEENRELLLGFMSYPNPFPADPENVDTIWSRMDDLKQLEMDGARISVDEGDMGVLLGYVMNHFFALNHWDAEVAAPSMREARVDYETLIITARFRTDELLKLVALVPSVAYAETGKVKDIFMPEATAEYVVDGTVYAALDGVLQRLPPGFARDDTDRMARVLSLALGYYGQSRCTLSFRAGKVSFAYPVGTLVRNTVGPEGVTGVGTAVTRQAWDFEPGGQGTSWQTGAEELDFVGGAGR